MEVSSGSVSEGGLSSASADPRGLTACLNVDPAWLKSPIMAAGWQYGCGGESVVVMERSRART